MYSIPPQLQIDYHSQLGYSVTPMTQYAPAPSPPQSLCSEHNSPSPPDPDFSTGIPKEVDILKHQTDYQIMPFPMYNSLVRPTQNIGLDFSTGIPKEVDILKHQTDYQIMPFPTYNSLVRPTQNIGLDFSTGIPKEVDILKHQTDYQMMPFPTYNSLVRPTQNIGLDFSTGIPKEVDILKHQTDYQIMPFPTYNSPVRPTENIDLDFSTGIPKEVDILKHQTDYQIMPFPTYNSPIRPTENIVELAHPTSKIRPAPSSAKQTIPHPYARLFAKKDEAKHRRLWNHALEKFIFDPSELSSMGAPQRRTIYISSLEAHIDKLHAQLLDVGFWPVAFEKLAPFKGLDSKIAKSMVAGLQHDASVSKLKLLELERAISDLKKIYSEIDC